MPTINVRFGLEQALQNFVQSLVSMLSTDNSANAQRLDTIIMTLQDILAKVTAQTTVDQSIVALLASISQQLKDAIANGADPKTLQAIADGLDANTKLLSDAVTANTPVGVPQV